ncbi:plasmid stabilisation system protein [Methylomusa anaerophila]|uniref:Plasmid stabilisation system protein n=1 Tax=Methylomusa anaerophila TaxID=1930071 RepID=A0A348AEP3_9FIRM|nr:plasmid stabilisation system protein [Methylomusa anaerophila]
MQENKYDIRLMSRGKADLAKIEEYYIQEGGKELADKIIERIFEEILIFEDCPRAGWPYKRQEQRLFPIYAGRYVVAYIIDEKNLQVKVVLVSPGLNPSQAFYCLAPRDMPGYNSHKYVFYHCSLYTHFVAYYKIENQAVHLSLMI